jgi:hypothetical protein
MPEIGTIDSGILLVLFSLQILASLFAFKAISTRDPSAEMLAWIYGINVTCLFDATIYIAFYNKQHRQIIHPLAIVYSIISAITMLAVSTISDMVAAQLVLQIATMPASFAFISYMFMK